MAEKDTQELIREAQEQAAAAVSNAYALTPNEYQRFIVRIKQSKVVKRGKSRSDNVYASIEVPYMSVDGKVKMARTEHQSEDRALNIETEIVTIGDLWFVKAVVSSQLLGKAVGHAPINFGGSGVDGSNPTENAETSAVGRALSFLGYGLYGTGISSADEMENALAQGDSIQKKPYTMPESQRADLVRMLKDLGRSGGEIAEGVAKITSPAIAAKTIEKVSREWEVAAQAAGRAIDWNVEADEPAATEEPPSQPAVDEALAAAWAPIFAAMLRAGISDDDFDAYLLKDYDAKRRGYTSARQLQMNAVNRYALLTDTDEKAKQLADNVRREMAKGK